MSSSVCLATGCNIETQRVFCAGCFHQLDVDIRRRLQIGATKTKRNPSDRRAARKYALVVMDAIEVLGEQSNENDNPVGETKQEAVGAS